MKKKKKLLVFFCFTMDVLGQVFNRDSMPAGVIGRVFFPFAPDELVFNILVAKKYTLNPRWWLSFGGSQ